MSKFSTKNDNPAWRVADVSKRLSFYQNPFHQVDEWVYDCNSNFVFQFAGGNITDKSKKLQEQVLMSLNSNYPKPIPELKLTIHKDDPNWILNNGQLFLIIRGWGNLTGNHSFSSEKASKIQDDFRDWIITKLSV